MSILHADAPALHGRDAVEHSLVAAILGSLGGRKGSVSIIPRARSTIERRKTETRGGESRQG